MRLFCCAAGMAVLLCVAACAPQRTVAPTAGQDVGRTVSLSYGTIVSIRPATLLADNAVVSNILLAIGGLGGMASSTAGRGQTVEVIIREDFAPSPISVVQTDEANFQLGERVTITRGTRTRFAPGAPPQPPGS